MGSNPQEPVNFNPLGSGGTKMDSCKPILPLKKGRDRFHNVEFLVLFLLFFFSGKMLFDQYIKI